MMRREQATWDEADRHYVRVHYSRALAKEIAAELGRTEKSVHAEARRLGLLKHRRGAVAIDFRRKALDLRSQGLTYRQIGQAVGASYETVRKHLTRGGRA
jgi:predicted transcriptional regulator